tara:strand:+ start:131 stop:277 length:147 start_codon:yes stop_codon:yes gene_type:complete
MNLIHHIICRVVELEMARKKKYKTPFVRSKRGLNQTINLTYLYLKNKH